MSQPEEQITIPRYMKVCMIIGVLSVVVLPMIVLGLAWRQYKIETFAAKAAISAPVAPPAAPSMPPAAK